MLARMAIHPGEVLAEDLEALGMSAAELSRQIRVPTNRITGILKGQRAVTGDTALRLAEEKVGAQIKALPKLPAARKNPGEQLPSP
jgi:addiction module HigA family antidote